MNLENRPVAIWKPIAFTTGLVVFAILMRLFLPENAVESLREHIRGVGAWGIAIYGVVYVLGTLAMVPGWILTVAAPALFGFGPSLIIVSIASTTGAALAFLVARYLARPAVAALARRHRIAKALDAAIAEGDWRVVALLRLSPIVPFNLQNYLLGLSKISFVRYTLASWIAMMPGTLLYVWIGYLAVAPAGGTRDPAVWRYGLLGAGLAATIAVTVYVARLARRKLRDISGDDSESEPDAD
jgi:uncharacterized membrane protein YdjX (TVP38/TMEM64 family)